MNGGRGILQAACLPGTQEVLGDPGQGEEASGTRSRFDPGWSLSMSGRASVWVWDRHVAEGSWG